MVTATAETTGTSKRSRSKKTTTTPSNGSAKRTMDDTHKKAIAEGREEARAVRRYLEAIDAHKPKRGRKVTVETLRERQTKVAEELATADLSPYDRLLKNQEAKDIAESIQAMESATPVDLSELEAAFVKVGQRFAKRKGIKKATFKELGVPIEVLKKAQIS